MLELRGIVKRFPGVLANDGIDFELLPGEIHTLLGENGAGKSTLMKIVYGLYRPDAGEILVDGTRVDIHRPTDAIELGIGMVHQHFMLVDTLTVAENVAMGLRSSRRPLTDLDVVAERIVELGERFGLPVDPHAVIWQLSVGQRQRVEILKALYRDARLLILDEPTAVLTPQEADQLFDTLRTMTEDGRGIIFISHKLREVLALSDRITVLRHGKVVGEVDDPTAVTREDLARMMVGRDVKLAPDKAPARPGPARLRVRGLRVHGDRGTEAVSGIDLEVRGGEIVGIAGVSGNGQRELAEAIAGLRRPVAGEILVGEVDVAGSSPAEIHAAGVRYISEARMREGAIPGFTVAENLLLVDHGDPRFRRGVLFDDRAIEEHGRRLVAEYRVKTPGLDTPVEHLSGGNIQKLIVARELSARPDVLIAAQPTRGVDIGAAEYIHARLVEERDRGTAVLVISEDLDEILALADRIAVIYEGRIVDVVERAEADREVLGLMMAGGHPGSGGETAAAAGGAAR